MESERAWLDAVQSLVERKLGAPVLAVIDGNPGLAAALNAQWPKLAIQRCTNHKRWNLFAKAPVHLREELAEDYRRMIYAVRTVDMSRDLADIVALFKQREIHALEVGRSEVAELTFIKQRAIRSMSREPASVSPA